jgi:hypothetical protein
VLEVQRVGDVDPPLLVHAAHQLRQIWRPLHPRIQPVHYHHTSSFGNLIFGIELTCD